MKYSFLIYALAVSFSTLAQQDVFKSIGTVSSSYDEQAPVLSPDGATVFFTVVNHPRNVGGVKDPGDIWYSTRTENTWSSPEHAGAILNNAGYNSVAGMSTDGSTLFLTGHYDGSGNTPRTQGISISRKSGSGWSKPQNMAIPYFHNKNVVLTGYISSDLTVFVYSAESYGSRGVEDIYVCLRNDDGTWSAPKNLGNSINTQFQEVSPSLSEDGKTLFFASNGRRGQGSFDIYSATRLDDSWTSWSEPANMTDINSEGRELFFRLFEQQGIALYTSTVNSDGYGDIKVHVIPEWKAPEPELPVSDSLQTVTIEPDDDKFSVTGRVVNSKTGEAVAARLLFTSGALSYSTTAGAGGYTLAIEPTTSYQIRIEAAGYISKMEHLVLDSVEMKTLEMNFSLLPVEKGAVVNLKSVLFEQSTTNLLPESFPELDLVVSFLNENPTVNIELAGHTDNRGVHRDNVKLSQERVEKVKEYLVSKGVDAKRISGKGYGGIKPIASNEVEETRKLNRRVEFIIRKL